MQNEFDVIVVGSGSAALCSALAASEKGVSVVVLEKADQELAGGNSKYTAGAMRFVYNSDEDLLPLLQNPGDPRIANTEFGSYTAEKFEADLFGFNDGREITVEQRALISGSYEAMRWLAGKDVKFEPIYARQSFEKDGKHVFWGGLTLAAEDEGVGLIESEMAAVKARGVEIRYDSEVVDLLTEGDRVVGVRARGAGGEEKEVHARAVILACGGFESSAILRERFIGKDWLKAKVRGTPHNTGQGLEMAFALGAEPYGFFEGCHATPMDLHMPDYGNLEIPHGERKNYRKICYFLGIMVNAKGERFVDEGKNFRNYTYAQFGRAVLEQPGHFAWQVFDAKVDDLLYDEYRFHDAHYVQADTLDELVEKLDGIEDKQSVHATLQAYNEAVDDETPFDPTTKDGKGTKGLGLSKSNWAQKLDTAPFKAYPVTGGITFTYGGVKVDETGRVKRQDGSKIDGLYASGEMVGGVFFNGYPGGSGLTSGVVFGRRAGYGAADYATNR